MEYSLLLRNNNLIKIIQITSPFDGQNFTTKVKLNSEVLDWLLTNIGTRWRVNSQGFADALLLDFEYNSDLILFKLAWL
jgi:hypothetical protein